MASAIFECTKCKKRDNYTFSIGKKEQLFCPVCKGELKRVFTSNVDVGEVISNKMICVNQDMLYSQTDNKKDKDFF